MSSPSKEQVMDVLRQVKDPEVHQDLVTLNMIKDVVISNGRVHVHVELTTPACPLKDQITADVRRAVGGIAGVGEVTLEFSANVRGGDRRGTMLPNVRNVVAVGAGKGGVGKSTVSVLLAVGLARSGASVGLLDADIYGPSIPTMMGVVGIQPMVSGRQQLLPIEAAGIRLMSMGSIVSAEDTMIWRGPMVHGVVTQFLQQVEWGPLDYLVVDLPPGTGDVPLTLAQSIPMTGAVVVGTPQEVALADVRRAVRMYQKLNVSCLGLIENMSYYLCPHCGHRDEIFAHGGGRTAAEELGIPFLGEIPLNAKLRVFADSGEAARNFTDTDEPVRNAIQKVIEAVAGQISVQNLRQVAQPTLSIE